MIEGSITYTGGRGTVLIARFGYDHPAGLIFTAPCIRTAKINTGGAVTYGDHGQIGELTGCIFSQFDGRLIVHFATDDAHAHLELDGEKLYGLPIVSVEAISCLTCGRTIRSGGQPCPCVRAAPRVGISQMRITGVTLLPKTHDEYLSEMKNILIADVGASVLANLIF